MVLHWFSENDSRAIDSAVVFLPGRGNRAYHLLRQYTMEFDFGKTTGLFALTPPVDQGFYPPPKNSEDQDDAVSGLSEAGEQLHEAIRNISLVSGVPRSRIAVVGFSMGAVTALNWATNVKSDEDKIGMVVCHSGAILEPWNVPEAIHRMPIVLNHSLDDHCFDWEERYLPMKRALHDNGYNALHAERKRGGHQVTRNDIACCQPLFESVLEKSLDWQPYWL